MTHFGLFEQFKTWIKKRTFSGAANLAQVKASRPAR